VETLPAFDRLPPSPPRPPAPPTTGGRASFGEFPRHRPAASRSKPRATAVGFLRAAYGELRKVAWPARTDATYDSVLLLLCVVLMVAAIAGFDGGLARAANAVFG
jgi:preprotein translocase SecE subunit